MGSGRLAYSGMDERGGLGKGWRKAGERMGGNLKIKNLFVSPKLYVGGSKGGVSV